jgi:DNA-binding NarL/FixJ family response regulator
VTNAEVVPSTTRVLVVDDDDDFRRSTARVLSRHGYSCLEASSGAEARGILDKGVDVDVALCDIMMPGTSGIELLAELAARFPELAIVMTTALDDPRVAEEAFNLGAAGYLTKPFEANELLINLACAVRRRDLDSARRVHLRTLETTLAGRVVDNPSPAEEPSDRTRILIVDDHAIFTQSLARLLGSKPELEVVGTADTVSLAVAATVALKPHVVLMDFELPDGDGTEATAQIKVLMPSVHVIMLTARPADQAMVRAIESGCSGFVNKADTVDCLFAAIVAACDDELITPPHKLAPLLRQLPPTQRGLGADLTPREHEVLELMASGLINKQVATRLGLRLNTVRNHSQNILYKLQAHSRLEAVAIAVRDGIIGYPISP